MAVQTRRRRGGNRWQRRADRVVLSALVTVMAAACSAPAVGPGPQVAGRSPPSAAVTTTSGTADPMPGATGTDDETTMTAPTSASVGRSATTRAPQPTATPSAAGRCPGARCVSIAITGDVLLHPPLVQQARADSPGGNGMDFRPMLSAQAPFIKAADLGICHLETPLAPAGGPFAGYPEFSVPPQVLTALTATGYDACSTASNHTLDQGTPGLNRTLDELDAAGLTHDGSYRTPTEAATPTVLTTAQARIGFISVTYGLNTGPPEQRWQVSTLDLDAILGEARAARASGADLVVVAVHAGTEYDIEPNADQQATARALLGSPDVDLVYGHHAHVVQPLQKINGKWVIYGLGNNIAAQQTPVEGTHRGLLATVTFSQGSAGRWTTTDLSWVASLQDADPPHRWCPLGTGTVCRSADADADALAATTDAVNLYGADTHGAHPLQRR